MKPLLRTPIEKGALSSASRWIAPLAITLITAVLLSGLACARNTASYRPYSPWKDMNTTSGGSMDRTNRQTSMTQSMQDSRGWNQGSMGHERTRENPTEWPTDDYTLAERKIWGYDGMPAGSFSGRPAHLLRTVGFRGGSSGIDQEAKMTLVTMVNEMKAKPNQRVLVIGFTDGVGEGGRAEGLGMNRAEEVRNMLTGEGIARDRIQVASFGSRQSKAIPTDTVAQERDRRVEIWEIGS